MNKISARRFPLLLITFVMCVLTSCEKDEPKVNNNTDNENKENTTKISPPKIEKYLTTTTKYDVTFRCRFNNGGDETDNMRCTVHWCQYGSKPSTTPQASDMRKHETMRLYGCTNKTTTFNKEHSGFNGGTYIYYYFECSNSKYTTTTDVTYTITKR